MQVWAEQHHTVVVAKGKPGGAAPCIGGMPGGRVMHMKCWRAVVVITGNGLWASMTRSLRVDHCESTLMLLL